MTVASRPATPDRAARRIDTPAPIDLQITAGSAADAALSLAHAGWPVFPCRPGSKRPATRHGFRDATTDPDVITKWWSRLPDANLATPTGASTVDVLDVDRKGVADGMPAFERLRTAGMLGGAIAMVRTPSGGLHIYYRGTNQGNGSLPRHGIDFRSTGGYVLVPPSKVDGRSYRWLDWRESPRGRAVDWPAIRRLLDPPRPQRPRAARRVGGIGGLAGWLAGQPEGNRNHALYWAACRALESGHGAELDQLVGAAVRAGLGEIEARRTVGSAVRRLGGTG